VQKEAFLYNSSLQMTQQRNEVEKYRQLIENDDEIIRLRSNIKQSAEAKVANGTLTVSDLVREINAETLARQNKALHETQLLISIYNLKIQSTNNNATHAENNSLHDHSRLVHALGLQERR
jgi:hypothetical protein